MITAISDNGATKKPVPVKLAGISDVAARAMQIHHLIARRAYAIYEGRGHVHGHDQEDWLQAKSEVLASLCVGFTELNGHLRVDVGVAASELPQLRVNIEPRRMILSGKRNSSAGQPAEGHEKPRPVEIFQAVDFPAEVEPSGARVIFSNGLVELTIPKAAKGGKSAVAKAA